MIRKKESRLSKQVIKELSIKFITGFGKPDDIDSWQHHLNIMKQVIQTQMDHMLYSNFESIFTDYLLVYHSDHEILKAKFGEEVQKERRSLFRRYVIQTLSEWLVAVDAERVLQNTRDIRNTWIWREMEPLSNHVNKGRGYYDGVIPFACNQTEALIDMIREVLSVMNYPQNGLVKLTSWGEHAPNAVLLSLLNEIGDKTNYLVKPHRRSIFQNDAGYHWREREIGLRYMVSVLFGSQENWNVWLDSNV